MSARAAEPQVTSTAPLEVLKTGHIAVKVKLNGQGPFRLVLDTGSPVTLLNNRVAEKIGLVDPKPAKTPTGNQGNPLGALLMGMGGQKTVKTVDINGAKAQNISVIIMDHPTVEMLSTVDGPLDGIVGFSFFAKFRTTIDYAAGQVTFTPVDYQPQDIMAGLVAMLQGGPTGKKVLAPSALWGLTIDKLATDEADGVVVTRVYSKSAADSAGLQAGDRILTIDGRWTDSVADCYEVVSTIKPGQTASVKVNRGGKALELKVQPRVGL
jgi:S1-C subfamily serine protease